MFRQVGGQTNMMMMIIMMMKIRKYDVQASGGPDKYDDYDYYDDDHASMNSCMTHICFSIRIGC